jgi:CHAT domain-containing protein
MGIEIDGFAELAQRLGANAVIASVGQIATDSTPILMKEFYTKREMGITKAEALRQAQLKLLNGTRENKSFAHPFYWSPFILIGNWK